MCGRYSVDLTPQELENLYSALFADEPVYPQVNVAPTSVMPIILNIEPNVFHMVKWGIVPIWVRKQGKTTLLNNVRSESIMEKPTFKKDFNERRCIIPATSFFEWETVDKKKIPYLIKMADSKPFSFAGIWSEYKDENDNLHKEYSIITTEANELLGKIHNRMPVIIDESDREKWLSDDCNADDLISMLTPYSAEMMTMHKVSDKINNPRNNHMDLLNPL